MKFKTTTQELLKALSKVISVVPTKTTIPILENILFDLVDGDLTISATDIDIAIETTMEVEQKESGTITIPAKRLFDTIKALPETDISISSDNDFKIKIKTPNGEYKISGENAENYPTLPEISLFKEIYLEGETLKNIINRTAFCVSGDELRPSMTGVLFDVKGRELITASTDGHRLSKLTTKIIEDKDSSFLIPAKVLHLVKKAINGNVNIFFNDKLVKFDLGESVLISKLIEETYPDYNAVIPQNYTDNCTVSSDLLLAMIKRVSIYANQDSRQIVFDVMEKQIIIRAEDNNSGGSAHESLVCESNAEITIGFNATYLIDILSHFNGSMINMSFETPIKAVVFKPEFQKDNEDYLALVMPVRLNK